jgi:SAM-dependent methyltransferase
LPEVSERPREAGVTGDADYLLEDLACAEAWHFWFRARRKLVLWTLHRYFPDLHRVLEVGCGTGFVLDGLRRSSPNLSLAGCDIHPEALRGARRRVTGVGLFRADACRLPVRGAFDAVMALDVIEHLDDDRSALAELFRALKPGGGLLVMVPQHQWLWSAVDEFSRHRRRYHRADLVTKARAAGFDVLRCTSFFSGTLPLVVTRRLWPRDRTFDPTAELRLSPVINAAAAALLQPEWWLFRAGVSMPIGGSLVLVARRPPQ